jgi:hypothetical protein
MEATMQELESTERRVQTPEPVPAGGHRATAAARRSYRQQIRASVRTQLSNSRRRRHELSQVLSVMRNDLFEFRTWLRARLRHSSSEAPRRKVIAAPAAAPSAQSSPVAHASSTGASHAPAA